MHARQVSHTRSRDGVTISDEQFHEWKHIVEDKAFNTCTATNHGIVYEGSVRGRGRE